MYNNNPYLSGRHLYGDDFSEAASAKWFEEESHGYFDLSINAGSTYTYNYHFLNYLHGYRFLPWGRIRSALGFGCALGHELRPYYDRLDEVCLFDPGIVSDKREIVGRTEIASVRGSQNGDINIPQREFDLITCFGVLHHIPTVTGMLARISDYLAVGGRLLIREPIVSMGDWTKRRQGLTKNERGIPRRYLRNAIRKAGLVIEREAVCQFSAVSLLSRILPFEPYNNYNTCRIDALLSRMFAWNGKYHRTTAYDKISPVSVFLLVTKGARR